MTSAILYSTEHCHLCEDAIELIQPIALALNILVEVIDITESEQLVEQFGSSIPVLKSEIDQSYLYWPFSQEQVYQLLLPDQSPS